MNVTTVDENEMKKFDAWSPHWWDPNGIMKGLIQACPLVSNYVEEVTLKNGFFKEDMKILNVGCGGGLVSESLARRGFSITGIDVNSNLIKVAQDHANLDQSLKNLVYKHEAVEEHSVNNPEKYDVVLLTFVLQHVTNHDVLLEFCTKALKPGGLIIVMTVAKSFASWLRIVVVGELILGYLPVKSHDWHKFISARDVETVLNQNNCVVKESKGITYDVFSKSYYWCDNVDGGFYSVLATKK